MLKPEVQILGSLKSIRHAKVEILRLKSCFLRKKETTTKKKNKKITQIFETHFQMNYSFGVRDGYVGFLYDLHLARKPRPRSSNE